jgi:Flp pilus assembly protein TadD
MRQRTILFPFVLLLPLVPAAGCQSESRQPPADYQTVGRDPQRDADAAARENARGADLMDHGDWAGAEAAFKAALTADVLHGPAHNNLGKVYFHQGKLYLAAWEFQYAMKLMPNQPEPLNNLGLVFEAAGKLDDAVASYDKAAALEPDGVEPLGNLARARYRRGDRGDDVKVLLNKLVVLDTRPDWLRWAKTTLVRMEAGEDEGVTR